MHVEKISEKILALRAEISGHVKGEADLASEKTLELSRRLDELIAAYYKCIAGKGGAGQE